MDPSSPPTQASSSSTSIQPDTIVLSTEPLSPKQEVVVSLQYIPNPYEYEEDEFASRKGWTAAKCKALIQLYKDNRTKFFEYSRKKTVWEMISEMLNKSGGIQFNGDECNKKWRNLKDRYRRILKRRRNKGNIRSSWSFFNDMDEILSEDPEIQAEIVKLTHTACKKSPSAPDINPTNKGESQPQPQPELSHVSYSEAKPAPSSFSMPGTAVIKENAQSVPPPVEIKRKYDAYDEVPGWFATMMMEIDRKCAKRQKKMRKRLKKFMKIEKKRNKLLEQILNKQDSQN